MITKWVSLAYQQWLEYNTMTHSKKQENVTYCQKGEGTVERDPNIIQILELADGDFKAASRTMLKDEKEKMVVMNVHRWMLSEKWKQKPKWSDLTAECRWQMGRNYPLWGIKNQKKKRLDGRKTQNLKATWGDIQQFNAYVIGFPEGEERENRAEKRWVSKGQSFPKFGETMNT